jgi:hypothetical protein
MKQLQYIILLVCIATSIHADVQQVDNKVDAKNYSFIPESTKNINPDTVIYFFAQDDDDNDANNPSGRYWPAETTTLNGKLISSASAYIGDATYSDVVEEKSLLPDQELRFLGYFTNKKSEETIYLYGTKDTKTPNDANEETVTDDDDDSSHEDEDN